MSRTNPRTVILAALQEGACSRINMWWYLMRANGLPENPMKATAKQAWIALRIDGHLDRHLCKLIRSRRVVRLGDGRYALSNPWTRMLARCAKIDMDWRDFLPVPRNADAEAQDIARRHGMGAVAEARSIYSGKITIYLNGEDVGTVQVNPGDTPRGDPKSKGVQMSDADLLEIYKQATEDRSPRDKGEKAKIANEMRRVIAAPTEDEAIRIIEWWGNDIFVGPGTNLRTVRRVRELAMAKGEP